MFHSLPLVSLPISMFTHKTSFSDAFKSIKSRIYQPIRNIIYHKWAIIMLFTIPINNLHMYTITTCRKTKINHTTNI